MSTKEHSVVLGGFYGFHGAALGGFNSSKLIPWS